jgi:hypothetical protein
MLIKLCHTQGCCPVLRVAGSIATITDDSGGSVELSLEELGHLFQVLAEFFRDRDKHDPAQIELDFGD